jgi:bifunctional UDP-N-acetylglucosamine pyrophosphorylase / glucosamine-1-phosphate N-acetyltransferase
MKSLLIPSQGTRYNNTHMEHFGVVILAAGLGKRMRSTRAKVLHCLAGQPLLTRVINTTQRLHPDTLVAVVGHRPTT